MRTKNIYEQIKSSEYTLAPRIKEVEENLDTHNLYCFQPNLFNYVVVNHYIDTRTKETDIVGFVSVADDDPFFGLLENVPDKQEVIEEYFADTEYKPFDGEFNFQYCPWWPSAEQRIKDEIYWFAIDCNDTAKTLFGSLQKTLSLAEYIYRKTIDYKVRWCKRRLKGERDNRINGKFKDLYKKKEITVEDIYIPGIFTASDWGIFVEEKEDGNLFWTPR